MLNKKSPFFRNFIICGVILFCNGWFVSPSYAVNITTLNILAMIENKQYLKVSRLLEKEIARKRNKKTKGYYALLINQIPMNIPMRRARHEYTVMAALWAENISSGKRMQLWIEAGDSFFRMADLEKADRSYRRAFSLVSSQKAQSEKAYILYKRAWVQINKKEWNRAFHFLRQALEWKKKNKLRENILSDMGQIWVESHHSKNGIPFKELEEGIQLASLKKKKIIIKGMVKGISRIRKKGINKAVDRFSVNQRLSTEILNYALSKETPVVSPCQFLFWMEKVEMAELNKDKVLSILNTCTKSLLSEKRKDKIQEEQIRKVANLYNKFERRGIERWPLVRIYEYMGQGNEACGESLYQLAETAESKKEKNKNVQMKETLMESFRLCKTADISPAFSEKVVKTLLSSDRVIRNYQTTEGEWENILFHLLEMDIFYPVMRKNVLKFDTGWKGKDLLPMLLLSRIQEYQSEEIKSFLNLFSPKPVESHYLDILLSGDFLTVMELQKWLPLSSVNSYRKTIPWFKKMVSEELSVNHKQKVVAKLLEHFPSEKKDKEEVSLFLALNYLKENQITEILKHWDLLSSAFNKKNLTVELFEKSLNNREKVCVNLQSQPVSKRIKSFSLLKFIDQCCQIISSERHTTIHGFKPPSLLRSNALARDFVFLVRVQNKTLWLEKNISQLENKTSRMIMNLQSAIAKYQKRKWKLNAVATKSETFLQKQIDIFEMELTKLASSSPHAKKYRELKTIVSQWR